MKKHFMIVQPPLAKYTTFLVDDINESCNWGETTDIDKIEYNRRLFDEEYNIDLKIKLLFTAKGGTAVMPIGRFITVMQLRNDENEGFMTFMDFHILIDRENLRKILLLKFSESITDLWLKIYDVMIVDFSEEADNVVLVKPNDLGLL